jgi:hypothetical protein
MDDLFLFASCSVAISKSLGGDGLDFFCSLDFPFVLLLSSRDGVLIRDLMDTLLMDNGTDRRRPSRRRFIHAA